MSLRAVSGSGSGSGASPLQGEFYNTPGSYSYTPTKPINFIKACGGGGGGAGGWNAANSAGGGGGGQAPVFKLIPIMVTPGVAYTVVVGAKGTGGAAGVDGTDGGESYIDGASIIDPMKDSGDRISFGYGKKGKTPAAAGTGGLGGGSRWSVATDATAIGTEPAAGAAAQVYHQSTNGIWLAYMEPFSTGSSGGAASSNGGSGLTTLNGNGNGQAGTGTAAGGGGGSGGGSAQSRGGQGGQPATPTAGQVGTGKGAGGGGGTCQAAGGDGTDGHIWIYE